jgi:hypothetical protein
VPGWNDQPETMGHVLMVGKDAGAIVFTGCCHKAGNAACLRGLGVQVPYEQEFNRRKVLPAGLDARVIRAWRESGISTPLSRRTSCGVSAAHGAAGYNGHWGVRELCGICPVAQTALCPWSPAPARRPRPWYASWSRGLRKRRTPRARRPA